MNKLITINLSYYNQSREILMKHINEWREFPKEFFTFFIIDDGSKIPIHKILKNEKLDFDLHIYRVKKDLYCNIAGVRNLGAKECKTPWMIILDMDTVISKEMGYKKINLSQKNINNNIVFKFNRKVLDNINHIKNNKFHPAVCLIRKKDYWNIGGCEEDLVGHYGYTDPSFWYRAKDKVKIKFISDLYLLYYPEGEAEINRDSKRNKLLFEYKKKLNNWSKNFIRFEWEKIKI